MSQETHDLELVPGLHDSPGLRSLPATAADGASDLSPTLCDLSSASEDEHEQMLTPVPTQDSSPAENCRPPSQWTSHFRKLFPDSALPCGSFYFVWVMKIHLPHPPLTKAITALPHTPRWRKCYKTINISDPSRGWGKRLGLW